MRYLVIAIASVLAFSFLSIIVAVCDLVLSLLYIEPTIPPVSFHHTWATTQDRNLVYVLKDQHSKSFLIILTPVAAHLSSVFGWCSGYSVLPR